MTEKELIEAIKAHCDKETAKLEAEIDERFEEREDKAELWFYDMRLDKDGMPNSYGHSDDCYSDGFDVGHKDGKYDALSEILKMIREA